MPTTFVRPVFFMDNFPRFMTPTVQDGTVVVRMPMPGDVPLQMIAATDVAVVSVTALLHPERVTDGAVETAGEDRFPDDPEKRRRYLDRIAELHSQTWRPGWE